MFNNLKKLDKLLLLLLYNLYFLSSSIRVNKDSDGWLSKYNSSEKKTNIIDLHINYGPSYNTTLSFFFNLYLICCLLSFPPGVLPNVYEFTITCMFISILKATPLIRWLFYYLKIIILSWSNYFPSLEYGHEECNCLLIHVFIFVFHYWMSLLNIWYEYAGSYYRLHGQ